MKIKNKTDYDTRVLRTLCEIARKHVVLVDEKISTWGPKSAIFQDVNKDGAAAGGASVDYFFMWLGHKVHADRLLSQIIWHLRFWGAQVAESSQRVTRGSVEPAFDPVHMASLLEGSGVNAGLVPMCVHAAPTDIDLAHTRLAGLAARERAWNTRAKRAATALAKIARDRARIQKKLAKLTGESG